MRTHLIACKSGRMYIHDKFLSIKSNEDILQYSDNQNQIVITEDFFFSFIAHNQENRVFSNPIRFTARQTEDLSLYCTSVAEAAVGLLDRS